MDRSLPTVLALFAAALVASSVVGQELQIATVDMEEVFDSYHKTTSADKELKEQQEAYETHAKELAEQIQAARQERDEMQERALNVALSKDVREECRQKAQECEQRYQDKQAELREFVERTKGKLQKDFMEKRKKIVEEISAFIRGHAEKQGFDFVFDASGFTSNMIPVVIYASPATDITAEVVENLNEGH